MLNSLSTSEHTINIEGGPHLVTETSTALMAIRKPFSTAILEGRKLVELRRVPIRRPISHVIIYESRGAARIVGVFEVKRVIEDKISTIWDSYNGKTCLTKKEFYSYFGGRSSGTAIEIGEVIPLDKPCPLSEISLSKPPQNFQYVPQASLANILNAFVES